MMPKYNKLKRSPTMEELHIFSVLTTTLFFYDPIGIQNALDLNFSIEDIYDEYDIEVHGSLTYADGDGEYPVKSNLWWFGFDCMHAGDYEDTCVDPDKADEIDILGDVFDFLRIGGGLLKDDRVPVRTESFVIGQCEYLATQLKEIGDQNASRN